jgi:hypothetical protein
MIIYDWKPPEKEMDREWEEDHAKDGYMKDPMYKVPRERTTVMRKRWRDADECQSE